MTRRGGDPVKIAVIGDRFMLPSMFEQAIRLRCPDPLEISTFELPWPDEPMMHGYAVPGMDGLKEYQGDPDEVIAYVGDSEIVVTQLAPFSATMLDRLPNLKLIAVSRGGPVNIDMDGARARGILVVNAPGRNASAVAEFTIGVIIAETRLITRGHDALRKGVWRGDLYRADMTGEEISQLTIGVLGYGQHRDEGRAAAQGLRRPHPCRRPLRATLRGGHAGRCPSGIARRAPAGERRRHAACAM